MMPILLDDTLTATELAEARLYAHTNTGSLVDVNALMPSLTDRDHGNLAAWFTVNSDGYSAWKIGSNRYIITN